MSCVCDKEKINLDSSNDYMLCETSSKTDEPFSQKKIEWEAKEFKIGIQEKVNQILTFDEPLQQTKDIEYDGLLLSQFEDDNQVQTVENENNSEDQDNFDDYINYKSYMNDLINLNSKASRKNKKRKIKDGHTRERPDDLRDMAGTTFMKSIHSLLKERCKKYQLKIKKPNFKKQFGCNSILYSKFIKAKLYQIYIFNNKKNKDVIKKMTIIRKDKVFIDIMKCTFENLYSKYIEEEKKDNNTICIDENDQKKSFDKLTDMAEQKRNKLKNNKKNLSEEEINQRINNFIKYSKNLIKDIKGEGTLHKRSPKNPNLTLCEYEIIFELE